MYGYVVGQKRQSRLGLKSRAGVLKLHRSKVRFNLCLFMLYIAFKGFKGHYFFSFKVAVF